MMGVIMLLCTVFVMHTGFKGRGPPSANLGEKPGRLEHCRFRAPASSRLGLFPPGRRGDACAEIYQYPLLKGVWLSCGKRVLGLSHCGILQREILISRPWRAARATRELN